MGITNARTSSYFKGYEKMKRIKCLKCSKENGKDIYKPLSEFHQDLGRPNRQFKNNNCKSCRKKVQGNRSIIYDRKAPIFETQSDKWKFLYRKWI